LFFRSLGHHPQRQRLVVWLPTCAANGVQIDLALAGDHFAPQEVHEGLRVVCTRRNGGLAPFAPLEIEKSRAWQSKNDRNVKSHENRGKSPFYLFGGVATDIHTCHTTPHRTIALHCIASHHMTLHYIQTDKQTDRQTDRYISAYLYPQRFNHQSSNYRSYI